MVATSLLCIHDSFEMVTVVSYPDLGSLCGVDTNIRLKPSLRLKDEQGQATVSTPSEIVYPTHPMNDEISLSKLFASRVLSSRHFGCEINVWCPNYEFETCD